MTHLVKNFTLSDDYVRLQRLTRIISGKYSEKTAASLGTLINDLVETGKSLLLLGRPGVGKTTALREIARVLADDLNKRVVSASN